MKSFKYLLNSTVISILKILAMFSYYIHYYSTKF